MAKEPDHISMALFCDFENIALGVRDAQYEKFDIRPVLERLLLKGSIVVKKAYCDWERYKSFKAAMHEANFELIEIPHVRQSGKNSADIRMVVDALDLCYTKSHVNTFVIISGDSDFSPLVSKLRENAKRVIGVGVKQSTSDLLIANCDEFIYINDLLRKKQRDNANGGDRPSSRRPAGSADPQEMESRRRKGIAMAMETLEALLEDRSDDERVWASVVKEALKRRHPGFNEAYHGFKSFGALLEDAHRRGLLEFGRDEKSGAFVKRRAGVNVAALLAAPVNEPAGEPAAEATAETAIPPETAPVIASVATGDAVPPASTFAAASADNAEAADNTGAGTGSALTAGDATAPEGEAAAPKRRPRGGRGRAGKAADKPSAKVKPAPAPAASPAKSAAAPADPAADKPAKAAKAARKPRAAASPRRKKPAAE